MQYPKTLNDLIESFAKLPSIGKKTAERLALHIYSNFSLEDTQNFANSLISVKTNLKKCEICGNLSIEDKCEICLDEQRDKSVIMVVENIKDLIVLEKLGAFNGVYHVLNGAINFAAGVGIEDLEIDSLIKRCDCNIKEIIIACNATLEGETTSRYIKALLEDKDITISRIAHGLPVGGDITFADEMTVLKSLEGRRKY